MSTARSSAKLLQQAIIETTSAGRPELTKRPFLSHKRTNEELASHSFKEISRLRVMWITKGELAWGDPCKRPGKPHRVDFLQLVRRTVLSLSRYLSNPRVSLVLAEAIEQPNALGRVGVAHGGFLGGELALS